MNKTHFYLSPETWVTETKAMMPLCTSATIDGFSTVDEDFNMFNDL